jgi:hypothetical protein
VDDALNGPLPIYELQPVALKATSSRETLPSMVALGVVMDRDPNGSSQFGRALTYL